MVETINTYFEGIRLKINSNVDNTSLVLTHVLLKITQEKYIYNNQAQFLREC